MPIPRPSTLTRSGGGPKVPQLYGYQQSTIKFKVESCGRFEISRAPAATRRSSPILATMRTRSSPAYRPPSFSSTTRRWITSRAPRAGTQDKVFRRRLTAHHLALPVDDRPRVPAAVHRPGPGRDILTAAAFYPPERRLYRSSSRAPCSASAIPWSGPRTGRTWPETRTRRSSR
jgi:hypothetical protein